MFSLYPLESLFAHRYIQSTNKHYAETQVYCTPLAFKTPHSFTNSSNEYHNPYEVKGMQQTSYGLYI